MTLRLEPEALLFAWQYRYWSAERKRDRNRHGTEGTVELGVEIVGRQRSESELCLPVWER